MTLRIYVIVCLILVQNKDNSKGLKYIKNKEDRSKEDSEYTSRHEQSSEDDIISMSGTSNDLLIYNPHVNFGCFRNNNLNKKEIVFKGINITRNCKNIALHDTIVINNKENFSRITHKIREYIKTTKEGQLEKKSSGILGTWNTKYCQIENNQLLIFKNFKTGLLSGIVDFRIFSIELEYNKHNLIFTYYML